MLYILYRIANREKRLASPFPAIPMGVASGGRIAQELQRGLPWLL